MSVYTGTRVGINVGWRLTCEVLNIKRPGGGWDEDLGEVWDCSLLPEGFRLSRLILRLDDVDYVH